MFGDPFRTQSTEFWNDGMFAYRHRVGWGQLKDSCSEQVMYWREDGVSLELALETTSLSPKVDFNPAK